LKRIRTIADIATVRLGHAGDADALTGCSVAIFEEGAVAAHIACGVASGSRELPVFTPRHGVERVHGVCFSGGSAFGLAAANGAMRALEERGIGHATSAARVPLIAGAVIYDLALGDPLRRPDEAMGHLAANAAFDAESHPSGNVGAGLGATAGKLLGVACATKTGIGQAGVVADELEVAALVVLNPVGDVRDIDGSIIAGARKSPASPRLVDSAALIRSGAHAVATPDHNTTLVLVVTNARLDRGLCQWIGEQAAVSLARAIEPPFTRHDGDVAICASVGDHDAEPHRVGLLAREVVTAAIVDACRQAQPAGGLPNWKTLEQPAS